MATPIVFPEATTVLGAPKGAAPGTVARLPVRRDGGSLVSCWSLTHAEIEEIIETGVVWLAVQGALTQPPVLVSGHKVEVI